MRWKDFLTEQKELYQRSVSGSVSGRWLVRPGVPATVVTGVKVGVVSVPRGEDLGAGTSVSGPGVRVWRVEVVLVVGGQEVVRRRSVHHVRRRRVARRVARGQGPAPWRGHHVRVSVHLKWINNQNVAAPGRD